MKRDKHLVNQRAKEIQIGFNDPKKLARILELKALALLNCKDTSSTIRALKLIYCISERMIFNDLKKDLL